MQLHSSASGNTAIRAARASNPSRRRRRGISERSVVASVNMVSSGNRRRVRAIIAALVDDIGRFYASPPGQPPQTTRAQPRADRRHGHQKGDNASCRTGRRASRQRRAEFDAPKQVSRHFRSPPPPPRSRHEARGRCRAVRRPCRCRVQVGDWRWPPGKGQDREQKGRHEQPVKEAGGPERARPGLAGLAGSDVELHGHGGQNGRRKRQNG